VIRLNIPVEPMGAVRMTSRGKYIKPTAIKYLNYKKAIQLHVRGQLKNRPLLSGPLEVNIIFKMPIPTSWSKVKQNRAVGGYHTKKPDSDNMVKGVFDALNKLVWQDDNQVAVVKAIKVYGKPPGIEITINELSQSEGIV
jgi:Holliday junction resolvase RusA-like endonuclease